MKQIKKYNFRNSKAIITILLSVQAICNHGCVSGDRNTENTTVHDMGKKIVIEARISKHFFGHLSGFFTIKGMIDIEYSSFKDDESKNIDTLSAKLVDENVKWTLYADRPLLIMPPLGPSIIVHPGDSIYLKYGNEIPVYSGSNPAVLALLNRLMLSDEEILKPSRKNSYSNVSVELFTDWNKYLDKKLDYQVAIIDSFAGKIPEEEYTYYKTRAISLIEGSKLNEFSIISYAFRKGALDSSNINLNDIWDSTQCGYWRKWLNSLSVYYDSMIDFYTYNRMEVMRKFNFDIRDDNINSKQKRTTLYYDNANQGYKGMIRDRLLAYMKIKRPDKDTETD